MVSRGSDLGPARLSDRGLAVGLRGQLMANGIKTDEYTWGSMGRIISFIYELF